MLCILSSTVYTVRTGRLSLTLRLVFSFASALLIKTNVVDHTAGAACYRSGAWTLYTFILITREIKETFQFAQFTL